MYIVFKKMDEWLKKDANLEKRYRKTYEFIYTSAHSYAIKMSNFAKEKIGSNIEIKIEFSEILLKQSLIDAYDDLLRLKNYHPTEEPNPIKEMAYIVYWFLRHKPIRLVSEEIVNNNKLSDIARTRFLFINEEFCVKLLINSAFEGSKKQSLCEKMFTFGSSQINYYKHFLLYYLIYRMDSPKSLEAMMLGCTIHPVWEVNPIIWKNFEITEEDF